MEQYVDEEAYLADLERIKIARENRFKGIFDITTKSEEKKFYEKKVQYMDMADMKLAGHTLEEIGLKYKISREYVRQILIRYFGDIKFERQKRRKKPAIEIQCTVCKKIIMVRPWKNNNNRKYCGIDCRSNSHSILFNVKKIKDMSPEEFKIFNRERCKAYYHRKLKGNPKFIKLVAERNKKYNLKRKNATK